MAVGAAGEILHVFFIFFSSQCLSNLQFGESLDAEIEMDTPRLRILVVLYPSKTLAYWVSVLWGFKAPLCSCLPWAELLV